MNSPDSPLEKSQEQSLVLTPSMKAAVNDGLYHSAMIGAGESYLSTFGIFLLGTPIQIGALATLPALIGAFSQNLGVWAIDKLKKRRTPLSVSAALQAAVWLPILLLPYVFGAGTDTVSILIGLVIIYHCFFGFGVPIWTSLIGDIVPTNQRGEYFGYRSRLCAIFTFGTLMLAGFILDLSRSHGATAEGFLVIFLLSGVFRALSAYWLSRYDDPPYLPNEKSSFTFWEFIRRTPHSNFARFVIFVSLMNFSVLFAGPYFSAYMLRDLGFSYAQFMSITAGTTLAQFVTIHRWGRLSDRFGNKKILNICAVGLVTCPVIWLITANYWLILLFQLYCGFVWAGFNLAAANFIFDAVSPPKRARCSAYQAAVNGIFVFAGSIAGGWCATYIENPLPLDYIFGLPDSPYLFVFLISILLRGLVAAAFLRIFREVREVDVITHRDLIFQVTHFRPMAGLSLGLVTGIVRRKQKK